MLAKNNTNFPSPPSSPTPFSQPPSQVSRNIWSPPPPNIFIPPFPVILNELSLTLQDSPSKLLSFPSIKKENLTLAHHRVSSSSVVEHPTRSRRVVGSNPIWGSDFFRVYVSPRIYVISCCCYFSVSILT